MSRNPHKCVRDGCDKARQGPNKRHSHLCPDHGLEQDMADREADMRGGTGNPMNFKNQADPVR